MVARRTTVRHLFLSLLLVASSTVVVAQEVKVTETTLTGTVIRQTTEFVERTVNMIATPFLSDRDVECMARNIFYEAGGEPTEGKIAVGVVTLNRAQDGRFGKTVCDVVKARTVVVKSQEVKRNEVVQVGYFGRPETVEKKEVVVQQVPVCQFSWVCAGYARSPKTDDERWIESQEIAQKLARGEYEEERSKYGSALFFHNSGIRPIWAKTKQLVARTGRHIFYE
jgi:spore germination cell wall hydrolase CwlJ-like protein